MEDPARAERFWSLAQAETFMIPACWDYPIWDNFMYEVLCHDRMRLDAYASVISRSVAEKTVVEIGAGASLPLSRMCVESKAKKVYAIESDGQAAREAREVIERLGIGSIVKLIHGESTKVQLPELVDVCVSEIIGGIGSSEGAPTVLRDARRFLNKNATMIPQRCCTFIAPVCLPKRLYASGFIQEIGSEYQQAAIDARGKDFRFTRFEFYNFPLSHIIAAPAVFEDLVFSREMTMRSSGSARFEISTDSTFDGFLCWFDLYVDAYTVINSFAGTAWAPIYLPHTSIDVKAGDTVAISWEAKPGDNGINPDYFIDGAVLRNRRCRMRIQIASRY